MRERPSLAAVAEYGDCSGLSLFHQEADRPIGKGNVTEISIRDAYSKNRVGNAVIHRINLQELLAAELVERVDRFELLFIIFPKRFRCALVHQARRRKKDA